MRLSIITVVLNNPQVREALASIHAQVFLGELECIVIDGASTDGTLEVLRGCGPRIDRLVSEPDHGLYDAMNKGLRLATGEVIGFLNADDRYASPGVLASVVREFSDPAAEVVYGDLAYVRAGGGILRLWRSRAYQAGDFRRGWMPPHPAFFARRGLFERFGGFDPSFRIAGDFELMLRFLEVQGANSRHVPEVWVHMGLGGVSNRSVSNVWKANLECSRALRQHGLPPALGFMARKILRKVPQFWTR